MKSHHHFYCVSGSLPGWRRNTAIAEFVRLTDARAFAGAMPGATITAVTVDRNGYQTHTKIKTRAEIRRTVEQEEHHERHEH